MDAIEEKVILFQKPVQLKLTPEQVLLKFQNHKNLIKSYNDSIIEAASSSKNSLVEENNTRSTKNRLNNKLVIDNLYTNKLRPTIQIELDLKNDFKEIKKEFKKPLENVFFDIDSATIKQNYKLKERKADQILHSKVITSKTHLVTVFELPLNFEDLSLLTPIEYLCGFVRVLKPKMNRLVELFERNLEVDDYGEVFASRVNLTNSVTTVNLNCLEQNKVEELLEFLGIDKAKKNFTFYEFLAICLFSERYFLHTVLSTNDNAEMKSLFIYLVEQNLIENLDFTLIKRYSNELTCSEHLRSLLLFVAEQSNKLYSDYLKNMEIEVYKKNVKLFKTIHSNEYRTENYVKINQVKKFV